MENPLVIHARQFATSSTQVSLAIEAAALPHYGSMQGWRKGVPAAGRTWCQAQAPGHRRRTAGARSITMTSSTAPTRLASRLSSLAEQLGLSGKAARRMLDRARQLNLPFQPIALPTLSIWCQLGPQLDRPVDRPPRPRPGPVRAATAPAPAVPARLHKTP